jgi:hypothetical protein
MRRSLAQTLRLRCASLAIFAFAFVLVIGFTIVPAAAQYPGGGGGGGGGGGSAPPTTPSLFLQSLGYFSHQASQAGLTGIQQQIWAIEDRLQTRPASTRPIPFAEESPAEDPIIDSAFAALGYADKPRDPQNPMVVKATPAAEPPRISYSAWSQGFVDYENRAGAFQGTDIGRNTLMAGGIAATDMTIQQLTSASDAAVLGLLGGDTSAEIHNADGSSAHVSGPTAGAYGAYVNGAFSMDTTLKADFFSIADTITAGSITNITSLGLINYSAVGNVSYKQEVGTWWYQPTAGFAYTDTVWNSSSKALGMIDGTDWRLQGGVRFGSSFDWAGVHFKETLTLLGYDDVTITGGTLAVATGTPLAPTDEGKMFGQAIGRLEAELTKNWTASVEGEIRGRHDIIGTAGRLGLTYIFN